MSADPRAPVVLDVGESSCKVGFAGDDQPKCVYPTVIGRNAQGGNVLGQKAIDQRATLTLSSPVHRGHVTNWDDMGAILQDIFKETLKTDMTSRPILVSESPLAANREADREKMAEMMFETYKVPSFLNANQNVLALYSSGRMSGAVLNIGEGVTSVVPVFEGYAVWDAAKRVDFAGSDLTECLSTLFAERGNEVAKSADKFVVEDMKKTLCYVAEDLAKEPDVAATYTLPDGRTVTLGSERSHCGEALFSLHGNYGVHKMLASSIAECEMDTRKVLYKNIVLAGGSSLFKGLSERLTKEIGKLCPFPDEVRVSAPECRGISPWVGGSVFAALETNNLWVTRAQYEESGPQVLHGKGL